MLLLAFGSHVWKTSSVVVYKQALLWSPRVSTLIEMVLATLQHGNHGVRLSVSIPIATT